MWATAADLRASLEELTDDAYHLALHQVLVSERESRELALSVAFNRLRLEFPETEVSLPDAPLPAIAELGRSLNELRIQRRIYDYVAELLVHQTSD